MSKEVISAAIAAHKSFNFRPKQDEMIDAILTDMDTQAVSVAHFNVMACPTGFGKSTVLVPLAVETLMNTDNLLALVTAPVGTLTDEFTKKFTAYVNRWYKNDVVVIGPLRDFDGYQWPEIGENLSNGLKIVCVCDPVVVSKVLSEAKSRRGFGNINTQTISFHDEPHIGYLCPASDYASEVYGYNMPDFQASWSKNLRNLNLRYSIGFTATPGPMVKASRQANIRSSLALSKDAYRLLPFILQVSDQVEYQPINNGLVEFSGTAGRDGRICSEASRVIWQYLENKELGAPFDAFKPVMLLHAPQTITNISGNNHNIMMGGVFRIIRNQINQLIAAGKVVYNGREHKIPKTFDPGIARLSKGEDSIRYVRSNKGSFPGNQVILDSLRDHTNQVMFIIGDRKIRVGVDIPNIISLVATYDVTSKIKMSTLSNLQLFGRVLRRDSSWISGNIDTWPEIIGWAKIQGIEVGSREYESLLVCSGYQISYPKFRTINLTSYSFSNDVYKTATREFESQITLSATAFRKYVDDLSTTVVPKIPSPILPIVNIGNVTSLIGQLTGIVQAYNTVGQSLVSGLVTQEMIRDGLTKQCAKIVETVVVNYLKDELPSSQIEHTGSGGGQFGQRYDFEGLDIKGDVKFFATPNVALGTHYDDSFYVLVYMDKNVPAVTKIYAGYIPKMCVSATSDRAGISVAALERLVTAGNMMRYE